MDSLSDKKTEIVKLDVGGHKFKTTVSTLTRDCDSMLAKIFSEDYRNSRNFMDDEYVIHRDGRLFHYVLKYLRAGPSINLPDDEQLLNNLCREAEFFQLKEFFDVLKSKLKYHQPMTILGENIVYYGRMVLRSLGMKGELFVLIFCVGFGVYYFERKISFEF